MYVRHHVLARGVGGLVPGELPRLAKALGHHPELGGISADQEASGALHTKFGFEKVSHLKKVGFK